MTNFMLFVNVNGNHSFSTVLHCTLQDVHASAKEYRKKIVNRYFKSKKAPVASISSYYVIDIHDHIIYASKNANVTVVKCTDDLE